MRTLYNQCGECVPSSSGDCVFTPLRIPEMLSTKHLMQSFLQAMQHVYGPFETLRPSEIPTWVPPPMVEGHRGRYLWTDAFGVLNFITLSREMSDDKYLKLADGLINHVHDILGRTRDGQRRLPGATDSQPLNGGLRIGKEDAEGPDGDGQYFHYLTIWMFALNRMTLASGDGIYNSRAIELARVIHPHFMIDRATPRPRMFWKMSMNLTHPLVRSEGHLDPIDGYVVFNLLQGTARDTSILAQEISEYKKILDTKWRKYTSDDPLDLGMTLWTSHWFKDDEEWSRFLTKRALRDLYTLGNKDGYFDAPTCYRLAFREFGTCLGIQCHDVDPSMEAIRQRILSTWEDSELVPTPQSKSWSSGRSATLIPITLVMYCAAICPGAFKRSYFNE